MNKLVLPLLIGSIALCGCARHYVVKMSNGAQFTTSSKPKLKGNAYYFKDARGQERSVSAGRVREIQPASMAAEEAKESQFKPPTATRKRHWYWPF